MKIREAREKMGLTQEECAEALFASISTFQCWESKKRMMQKDDAARIAELLNMPFEEVYDISSFPKCSACGAPCEKPTRAPYYCSDKCRRAKSGGEIETECFICGKKIMVTVQRKQKWKHNYCSHKCRGNGMHKGTKDFICPCCGETFTRTFARSRKTRTNYCSRNCYFGKLKRKA